MDGWVNFFFFLGRRRGRGGFWCELEYEHDGRWKEKSKKIEMGQEGRRKKK